MAYFRSQDDVFPPKLLKRLRGRILACPYLSVNNLNRDFIGTRGFSVVFRRSGIPQVLEQFPFFETYLERLLLADCNAFYLNPLVMTQGSRVDPHIDRSLRSYCKTVNPPDWVSVLYVEVPDPLVGGQLMLSHGKKQVGQITPQANRLLYFQGNLTHAVQEVETAAMRLSLVCEQYNLTDIELDEIPELTIESRAKR